MYRDVVLGYLFDSDEWLKPASTKLMAVIENVTSGDDASLVVTVRNTIRTRKHELRQS
jgi:hypothetical protein